MNSKKSLHWISFSSLLMKMTGRLITKKKHQASSKQCKIIYWLLCALQYFNFSAEINVKPKPLVTYDSTLKGKKKIQMHYKTLISTRKAIKPHKIRRYLRADFLLSLIINLRRAGFPRLNLRSRFPRVLGHTSSVVILIPNEKKNGRINH